MSNLNPDPKIILINGPPRAGKDTFGGALADSLREHGRSVRMAKFAEPLKRAVLRIFFENGEHLPVDYLEDRKDEPLEELLGATFRQACIRLSEHFFKPLFGEDVFGRLLVKELDAELCPRDYVIVTDSGFAAEARVVVDRFGPENVYLIRVARDGATFEGDSRGYIFGGEIGLPKLEQGLDFFNTGGLPDLREMALVTARNLERRGVVWGYRSEAA